MQNTKKAFIESINEGFLLEKGKIKLLPFFFGYILKYCSVYSLKV